MNTCGNDCAITQCMLFGKCEESVGGNDKEQEEEEYVDHNVSPAHHRFRSLLSPHDSIKCDCTLYT